MKKVFRNVSDSETVNSVQPVLAMLQVFIKMIDTSNGNEFPWDKNKFIIRYGHMQDMYQEFEASGTVPKLNQVKMLLIYKMRQQ